MPGFRWDREKRLTLHLIVSQHKDTGIRAKIFNKVFQDEFEACGKPQGHPWSTLGTQYGERKSKEYWQGICEEAVSERERRRRQACQDNIDRALAEISGRQTSASASAASTNAEAESEEDEAVSSGQAETVNTVETNIDQQSPEGSSVVAEPVSMGPPATPRSITTLEPLSSTRQNDHSATSARWSAISSPRINSQVFLTPSPAASVRARTPSTVRTTLATPPRRATEIVSPSTPRAAISLGVAPIETQILPAVQPRNANQDRPRHHPEPVTQAQAYINPMPPLLFRCWSPQSQGVNSISGFKSAKSAASIFRSPPPPTPEHLDWDAIHNHINSKTIPGPFISASSSIVSTLRRALHLSEADVHVSIILSEKLDVAGVYYAEPFAQAIEKSGGLEETNSAIVESTDWLIWCSIPKQAIYSTFPISAVQTACERSPGLLQTILPILGETIAPDYTTSSLALTADTTQALAEILQILTVNHHAPIAQFSQLLSDMLQGCELQISSTPPPSHEDWQALADVFANVFINASEQPVSREYAIGLKLGFIEGVRYACGGQQPRQMRDVLVMQQHAASIGLPDISKVQELDNRASDDYVRRYVESEIWIRNGRADTE